MRVVKRTCTKLSGNTITEESYNYDAAGNITSCTVSSGSNTFVYDRNNRLISYNGHTVSYDADGNMISAYLNGAELSFAYDSANRLISAGQNSYTYNVEDVRVRNLCGESETTYAYNTNGRLSQLLVKTTDGVITKYVYGIGLIGEETSGSFKTYHFDYRGSTAAITDINGNVTDTFEYDTYGNLVSRTGTSVVIFLYNGRDGVVTDSNGLIYMRARYYSPELRRFINADIIAGEISNAVTLNRYAYANGNPVSNIDPFGLSAERGNSPFGSVVYDGVTYSVYVPDHITTSFNASWKTIKEITETDFSLDFLKFICGVELDDVNGLIDGSMPYMKDIMSKKQILTAGAASIFNGVLNSFCDSVSSIFLTFTFQQYENQRRVIIKAGSNSVEQTFNAYADGISRSAYFSNAGSPLAQAGVMSYAEDLYKEATGNSTKWYEIYDIEITVDKMHKGSKYASYLWIDSDGTIMQTPILYSNDRVEVGKRTGLFYFGFDSLVNMPINGSNPVSQDYQKLFSKAF